MPHYSTRSALLGVGVLFAVASLAMIGCDSASAPAGTSGGVPVGGPSPVDGRPIIELTSAEFTRGEYVSGLLEPIASSSAFQDGGASRRGLASDATVLLKDVLTRPTANRTTDGSQAVPQIPSTHLRVTDEGGQTGQIVLTLERMEGSRSSRGSGQSRGASSQTLIALDPDLFGDTDVDEAGMTTVDARVVETGEVIRIEIDDDGDVISPEHQNDDLFVVSGVDMVEEESAKAPQCYVWDRELDMYINVCPSSPGNTSNPPVSPPSSPRGVRMDSTEYLALRGLQLSNKAEAGKAEVQMYVQQNDDYQESFSANWNYRFDPRIVVRFNLGSALRALGQYVWSSQTQRDSVELRLAQIESALNGNELSNNTNNLGADMLIYEVPDVNNQGFFYSFTNMATIGSADTTNGNRLSGFPVLELSDQAWRGLLIEKDNYPGNYDDYTRKGTFGSLTHTEAINTYDVQSGSYGSTNTSIDGRRKLSVGSDDLIPNSGFRRATEGNVDLRLESGSSFTAQTGLFRYQFGKVLNRLFARNSDSGS